MATGIYSVTQINTYIKQLFTQDFLLTRVSVKGELSNVKYHNSGHIYFTLKDEGSNLNAVMFAGSRRSLTFQLKEGQMVVVSGNVNVYERDGKYQLYAIRIELEGIGDLYKKFEKLKSELSEMGMFAEEYKQPIPPFVKRLGVVTAPDGAALQDIMQIARRRNPYIQIILCPVKVQGEGAARSIVRGLNALDNQVVDCIIVGRGGGSLEDLWAFNEEEVARAIFNCQTPVISAVGHETDFSISDFVADLRAPTPSAAAEMAVFQVRDFLAMLHEKRQQLRRIMNNRLDQERSKINQRSLILKAFRPDHQINAKKQYIADSENRLYTAFHRVLSDKKHSLALYSERLNGLSPLNALSKGFAYTETAEGKKVASVLDVKYQDELHILYKDGKIKATVKEIIKENLWEAKE